MNAREILSSMLGSIKIRILNPKLYGAVDADYKIISMDENRTIAVYSEHTDTCIYDVKFKDVALWAETR